MRMTRPTSQSMRTGCPNLILLAKNCYVWLYQLSQKYKRPVNTLGEIPSEELDEIRRRGITGLWLIGIWERSAASRSIKRICGNPEQKHLPTHSGNTGFQKTSEERTPLRNSGTGASRRVSASPVIWFPTLQDWTPGMKEHPEYFLQCSEPPYPGYTFNGPDLSDSSEISLFLEDGYYDRERCLSRVSETGQHKQRKKVHLSWKRRNLHALERYGPA